MSWLVEAGDIVRVHLQGGELGYGLKIGIDLAKIVFTGSGIEDI